MFGFGYPEFIILVVIIVLCIAAGAGSFAVVYHFLKKRDEAKAEAAQKKGDKTMVILLACAGCSAGCLVIILVLSVLAAIAIPNFLMFQAKSKQSEARTILVGIYEAESAFYLSNNRYSIDPNELGFRPASEPKYYQWEIVSANDMGFQAMAWGNIDRDDTVDTWEVTEQSRDPVNTTDDVSQ